MRILFITSYPSPYRVDFWNLLGQYVDLTVVFTAKPEEQKHRSQKWFNTDYSGFNEIFLKDEIKIGKMSIYKDIFSILRSGFDHIILGGYTSGTQMAAIEYMRMHRIPFTIEADGGLIQKESKSRFLVKKHFISAASTWMSSGKSTTDYFLHYGAKPESIYYYPFTSQWKEDLQKAIRLNAEEKKRLRAELGIAVNESKYMILTVGQMIHRKGIDVLLDAMAYLPENISLWVVGAEPSKEYLAKKERLGLKKVHFEGFKTKTELAKYYEAADIFVMPTREDIWGLVINEAMSYGLPIVSTDRCGAALELVIDGVNGKIVPVEDSKALAEAIECIINGKIELMSIKSRERIKNHTMEDMVEAHLQFLQSVTRK